MAQPPRCSRLRRRVREEIVSAHRTPVWMAEFAQGAEARGVEDHRRAGGAAHLPGMIAAHTVLPVLGVPVKRPR